jgi:hypothetical protein
LTFRLLPTYSLGLMRILHFGLIVAFLMASTHMVVDHGGGPKDVVLIPHVSTLPSTLMTTTMSPRIPMPPRIMTRIPTLTASGTPPRLG